MIIYIYNVILTAAALQSKSCNVQISLIYSRGFFLMEEMLETLTLVLENDACSDQKLFFP